MFDKSLIKLSTTHLKKSYLPHNYRNELNIKNYSNFNVLILNKYEFESEFNLHLDFERNYSNIFTNAEKIIVTLGESGALLITKEENIYFSTKSKKFVNTIGAGDIFTGSYLMFEDVEVANQHTLNFLEELND